MSSASLPVSICSGPTPKREKRAAESGETERRAAEAVRRRRSGCASATLGAVRRASSKDSANSETDTQLLAAFECLGVHNDDLEASYCQEQPALWADFLCDIHHAKWIFANGLVKFLHEMAQFMQAWTSIHELGVLCEMRSKERGDD